MTVRFHVSLMILSSVLLMLVSLPTLIFNAAEARWDGRAAKGISVRRTRPYSCLRAEKEPDN